MSSDIVGVAVAGNSGGVGEGETDSYSEAIRNEDGTCSGWTGRDVEQPWTAGLESGAAFVILPRDGHEVIGEGTLGTSSFANVGTDEEPQWMCSFPFTGTVDGAPQEFLIKVGDLDPWLVRPDPTAPGQFVSSINTVASADYFPAVYRPGRLAGVGLERGRNVLVGGPPQPVRRGTEDRRRRAPVPRAARGQRLHGQGGQRRRSERRVRGRPWYAGRPRHAGARARRSSC